MSRRSREQARLSSASALVGMIAAIFFLGVTATNPGVFQAFSDGFVGLAASHHEDGAETWTCEYAPTMNHDRHDDVLCTKGDQHQRPHLLPGASNITESQLMRAAAQYERRLNR
jgi:hypothetical protein